ncbi:filamentous haemagglutinin family protein [Pseudomonas sp. Hp2]|uniref:filamentous haemagglutinin family protein n=1 Tax=Pseudomonas sp. Hp2 TaxID=701189 RepID=UPI0011269CF1|nr:filamentous haemagglutinin family protein [Pseudomonas sp. Hp2]
MNESKTVCRAGKSKGVNLPAGDGRPRSLRFNRLSHSIAALLLVGGVAGSVAAQQAFSPAWFANKGAIQGNAAATGLLPNGLPANTLTAPQQQSQAAREQLQQSIANLNTAAQAIALQQALQQQARQAALVRSSDIPNGLGEGGLKIDDDALTKGWLNANAPTQSTQDGRVVVNIEQTADKAILNWETFNVGRNTTVNFDQQAGWAVLNRVNDPFARPSQIQGRITGDGTVFLLNRNGILFDGSSQVNVRNLVAAAATMTDSQFSNSGLYSAGNAPSFTNAGGAVFVEQGALIRTAAPAKSTDGGGYVLLLGTDVANAGEIATPKGQAMLAAGDSFIIRKGVSTSGNAASTTRGNEVAVLRDADGVDAAGDPLPNPSGTVRNTGLIQAREGDVTLAGHDVRQDGVAMASTTVNNRGTVHLLNSRSDASGRVALGEGAVTAVLVEDDGKTTALDGQRDALIEESTKQDLLRQQSSSGAFDNLSRLSDRRDQSRVEIVSGGDVAFERDSLTLATGGQIAVEAQSRAFVAGRAQLDVAGAVGVQVAMDSNAIKLNVQGNEMRDSPLNRDGGLLSSTVWVDTRDLVYVPAGTGGYESERWYTPDGLLEVGGYLGNQGHRIGEWAAQGGTITLGGNEVVTQAGSTVNIAGGTLDVQSGYINQTWLRTQDGQVHALGKGPSNAVYAGLYTGYTLDHARWGVKEDFYSPILAPQRRLENGYTVGRDAGRLVISAPTAVLEGDIVADVFNGGQQTGARADGAIDGYKLGQNTVAKAGSLVLGRYGLDTSAPNGLFDVNVKIGQVDDIASALAATDALAEDRIGTAWLDADRLNRSGLGGIELKTRDSIGIERDLILADGGTVALVAPTIDIGAGITARSGSISATNYFAGGTGQGAEELLSNSDGAASITLGEHATLDVRGLWVNDTIGPSRPGALAHIDGGTVSLSSYADLTLAAGSRIDASSGAALLAGNKLRGGQGGDVSLSPAARAGLVPLDSTLALDGEIAGYGVKGGGTLKIETASAITIGGTPSGTDGITLSTDLFQSGFSQYDINGYGGLTVSEGTALDVTMPVYRLGASGTRAPTGTDPAEVLERWTPPVYLEDPAKGAMTQRGGASLKLGTGNHATLNGTLDIGKGAVVTVDPGETIELSGRKQITIDGALNAWGGRIAITDPGMENTGAGYASAPHDTSVWIGDEAVLDVAGRSHVALDANGRRYGVVQDGGSIEVGGALDWEDTPNNPNRPSDRFLIVRPGAVLDASGTSAVLDIAGTGLSSSVQPHTIATDGGSIVLRSANGLYLDGTLRAAAGGEGASGGTLGLALTGAIWSGPQDPAILAPRAITLAETQGESVLSTGLRAGMADANLVYGYGRLGLDAIDRGGFDHLSLLGDVRAESALTLRAGGSIRLYGSLGMAEDAAGAATLSIAAPYVRLAQAEFTMPFASEHAVFPKSAPFRTDQDERLAVDADLIDIRDTIDFAGFDDAALTSRGDIRLLDSPLKRPTSTTWPTQLLAPSSLTLTAAQIYPATAARARIAVGLSKDYEGQGLTIISNPDSRLTVRSNGGATPDVPYSAFGTLSLAAAQIDQGGVVRAPLGSILIGANGDMGSGTVSSQVDFLPGSLTSVSAADLVMPYGGTVDGIVYKYDGNELTLDAVSDRNENDIKRGISLRGEAIEVQDGAVLDLSGGGELTGAGFVSGRGGSVDVLHTALANASPAYGFSGSDNAVYAIVPSFAGSYAPVSPDAGAGNPAIGQQLTIPEGVPGLPAGTYTLMPSTYALLPGAFRVEIGAPSQTGLAGATGTGTGSYVVAGTLGLANTGTRNALPSQVVLTPADTVRAQSSYNETSYNAFVLADAKRRGVTRGMLTSDAKTLDLNLASGAGLGDTPALTFDGEARFAPKSGSEGFGGSLLVRTSSNSSIEILADGQAPVSTDGVALYASDLNAFGASRMMVGGLPYLNEGYGDNLVQFVQGARNVTLRSGAVLSAPEVFLVAGGGTSGGILVEQGASITTLGRGAPAYDSSDGFLFAPATQGVLAVSNGWINLLAPTYAGSTPIDIGSCASICSGNTTLYTEGTIAVSTNEAFTLRDNLSYGARNLVFGVSAVNLGSTQALNEAAAAGHLPPGMSLNQDVLSSLLKGNTAIGTPALETLVLNARESFNLFGSVELNTLAAGSGRSSVQRLVFGTPAIYGYGSANDTATITAGEFIWSGAVAADSNPLPGVATPAAPGAAMRDLLGDGSLDIKADRILLGYAPNTQPAPLVSADRLALGFGSVNLTARDAITSSGKGSLAVYHQQGDYVAGEGWQYSGGDLTLNSPLVTGESGSALRMSAGNAIALTGAGTTAGNDALGGELQLSARTIDIDTTVALASGKLGLDAAGDIDLGDNARIDLSGREVQMFDVKKYSWGGDLAMASADGDIVASAGSVIDLSAEHNRAGAMTVTALGDGAGQVDLAGTILGSASGQHDVGGTVVPYDAAQLTLRAQTLADFAGLNARLNKGGLFGARRFQIKQGDLVVGDGVKAREVQIVLDGGDLTVNGTIDASGYQVGAIRLAAMGDLTINGLLDAHATGLRVDSYGKIIDSPNRAVIDLTSREGTLTLADNAAIDLRAGTAVPVGKAAGQNDGVARGTLDLNAARVGMDDVAIQVSGPLDVRGAKMIAVNAFRSYDDAPLAELPDVSGSRPQLITQAYLDRIDLDSQSFIDAALGNAALSGRLANLGDHHLRPGVEIVSNATTNPTGNLTVSGDLDLSGYRYGPQANRADPALRGFGEPGALVLRAAGDLNIHGSINDGFAPPPDNPDEKGAGWVLSETRDNMGAGKTPFGGDIVIPIDGVVLDTGTQFPAGTTLNYDIPVRAATLPGGTTLPVAVTLTGTLTLAAGQVLAADVVTADGTHLKAGTVLPEALTLTAGAQLGAGTHLRDSAAVAAFTWPRGVPLPMALSTSGRITLARGSLIPSMTKVELVNDEPVNLWPVDADGRQNRRNWALAEMLPEGTTSWDLTAVAGADLSSADVRALNVASKGDIVLADTHYGLKGATTGGSALVLSEAGSINLVGDTSVAGLTEQEFLDMFGLKDFARDVYGIPFSEFCNLGGYCTTVEASKVLSEAGSINLVGDTSVAGLTEREFLDMFGLEDFARDVYGIPFNEFCNQGDFCSGGGGNNIYTYTPEYPLYSVLRTGSGDLSLLASRDIKMMSAFGIYTAGTQTSLPGGEAANATFNLPRGTRAGTTSILGDVDESMDYSAALAAYRAWYPDQGGNVLVSAGRDVVGDSWGSSASSDPTGTEGAALYASGAVGNWLWRQGSGSTAGMDSIATSWWINFGTYVNASTATKATPRLVGFTGIGALGGGNVQINAGRDAGVVEARGDSVYTTGGYRAARSQGLVAAVGSTGRVVGDDLVLTGGGDLSIKAGGAFNADLRATSQESQNADRNQNLDLNGVLTNLRGALVLESGMLGGLTAGYGGSGGGIRTDDPFTRAGGLAMGGPVLVLGDAVTNIDTRGDLVLGGASDPGRVAVPNTSPWTWNGVDHAGQGLGWFSLWTRNTAINLFSAGGDLTPTLLPSASRRGSNVEAEWTGPSGRQYLLYPSIFSAVAAGGDIKLGRGAYLDTNPTSTESPTDSMLLLAPSTNGELELLAGNAIYATGHTYSIGTSGADAVLPSPFAPAFAGYGSDITRPLTSNLSVDGFIHGPESYAPLFAFGPNTAVNTALHAGSPTPTRIYAVDGDIVGLNSGAIRTGADLDRTPRGERTITTWYEAGAPVWMRAGRDILGADLLAVHSNGTDTSLVEAGRDIVHTGVQVAGPGSLEISAGRTILMEDRASVTSIGPIVAGDTRPGASVAMMAGMDGVDWTALRERYLDPANLADSGLPLADQPGKVAKTYEEDLAKWLSERFGFSGSTEQTLAYFDGLAPEQQRIFLREVYYSELREGGREYNDPDSRRYGSYLRGRNMIATLFPDQDAGGQKIERSGDIVMYGGSGVHTNFGGNIEMMAPGGQIVVGVQGEPPPASAGVMTQGQGDIRLFSEQSLLLGLSRIMTTFGGDILAWSEEGDINAGRGARTTVLYTPPRRTYDQWGNVALAPQVPSSGAGIATLNPIPEVAPGDVDLIAPLGTIDAGEAGIRVSGNVNLAALQVLNAQNIQVQGESTGLPVMASVNVSALTSATAAAGSAVQAAQDMVKQQTRQARPSVIQVQVLGFGDRTSSVDKPRGQSQQHASYDPGSAFQFLGSGQLSEEQAARLTDAERRNLGRY